MADLSRAERALLEKLAAGAVLKVHRMLDGGKEYRLYPLDGAAVAVDGGLVDGLLQRNLLASNMKFPTAVFLPTEQAYRLCRPAVRGHDE